MSSPLAILHADQTERLILQSAVHLLEQESASALTVRAVARQAGISERTIFRYFPDRNAFLDAVAAEVTRQLSIPPAPETIEDILAMPRKLFEGFESRANLTRASMHSDLYPRMRSGAAQKRWEAIRKIVSRFAPRAPEQKRKIAAANIRYFVSAAAWNYYRAIFRFSLEDTIASAETAIQQALDGLKR